MLVRILAAITLLAVAITWVPWSVQPAAACTCAQRDPVTMLNEADAAFVGRPIAQEIPNDGPVISSADPVVYTFEVEQAVKGDMGDQVQVHSLRYGMSCGLEFFSPERNRSGILLSLNEDGSYSSGLCSMVDPDILITVSQPLPPPDGEGPIKYLVGGRFGSGTIGEARVMALDEQGRTLAYGFGTSPTGAIAVCPGGRHAIEAHGGGEDFTVSTRSLNTFETVGETRVFEHVSNLNARRAARLRFTGIDIDDVLGFACLNEDGDEAVLLGRMRVQEFETVLARIKLGPETEPETEVLSNEPADFGALNADGSAAYIVSTIAEPEEGQDGTYSVRRIDVGTGEIIAFASFEKPFDDRIWSLAPSPDDEQTVAITAKGAGSISPPRLVLIKSELDVTMVHEEPLPDVSVGSKVFWTDGGNMLVIPIGRSGPLLFDRSFALLQTLPGIGSIRRPALSEGEVHGLVYTGLRVGALASYDIASGELVVHREFDPNMVLSLVPVEGSITTSPVNQPVALEDPNGQASTQPESPSNDDPIPIVDPNNPGNEPEPGGSGGRLPNFTIFIFLGVVLAGYALWHFAIRSRESTE